jgi:hypothetical protein
MKYLALMCLLINAGKDYKTGCNLANDASIDHILLTHLQWLDK